VQSLAASELINLDRISDVKPSDLSLNEVSVNVMGVEHDFSELNANQESQSNDYLQLLDSMTQGDLPAIADKLDGIEKQISDPAVRAFLQMHRLTKQTNQ